jgi:hypothetical protein
MMIHCKVLFDAEILLDRGQGDVHDRDIEHDHELRRARQDEDHSFICVCLGSHYGFLYVSMVDQAVAADLYELCGPSVGSAPPPCARDEARKAASGDPEEAFAGDVDAAVARRLGRSRR